MLYNHFNCQRRLPSKNDPACQQMNQKWCKFVLLAAVLFASAPVLAESLQAPDRAVPTLKEALASTRDIWGEAAIYQPGGPNFEFFAKLLPPLRYVNAAFRHYPIVLSAPGAPQKARLVSNGSAINAHAQLNTWHELGIPVSFHVGPKQEAFGSDLRRLTGPHYESGHLPVVRLSYTNQGCVYELETFAGVEQMLAEHGVVLTRFRLTSGRVGEILARLETPTSLTVVDHTVRDAQGQVLLWFDRSWQSAGPTLKASLSARQSAALAIATKPMPATSPNPLAQWGFDRQRARCVATWESLLVRGMQIEVPERLVNDAWRSLVIGTFALADGDRMNYSAGNAYQRLFEAESGDATRALLLWGFTEDTRRMLGPLLEYQQPGVGFHDAGFKLQLLAHYYWLTRDSETVRALRPRWQTEVQRLADSRTNANGLLPREQYCGDIATPVFSLNSNANGWRGLRDLAAVLAGIGEPDMAEQLASTARDFRQAILAAVEKSERRDVTPPFIPIALFGQEKPYQVLTASQLGSYWDLMAPYLLGSGIFGPGSEREQWILHYLHQRGGICMGMVRFHQHSGLFANEDGVDDLYGLRYVMALLQRDEVDRALVSFYGKLAQGLTRDTFIGAEGTGLKPLDPFGRPMYLPPSSAGNAYWLWTLRHLLVQDWDLDDDGEPETLRLLFATPRRWLDHGQAIQMRHAPTAFGEVSLSVQSRLRRGEVIAAIDAPTRQPPKRMLLRIRVPESWQVVSARVGLRALSMDARGTMDLTPFKGRFTVRCKVRRASSFQTFPPTGPS